MMMGSPFERGEESKNKNAPTAQRRRSRGPPKHARHGHWSRAGEVTPRAKLPRKIRARGRLSRRRLGCRTGVPTISGNV